MLDRLHRGAGEEVDVGYDGNMGEAGGGKLGADVAEAAGGGDVGGGDADDLAADFGESDGLLHGGGDILRVARRHRLDAHGVGAADADGADPDFMGVTADGLETGGAVGRHGGMENGGWSAWRAVGGVMDYRVAALLAMTGDYLAGVLDSAREVFTSRTMRRTSKKLT